MPELLALLRRKPEQIEACGGLTLSDDTPDLEALTLSGPSNTANGVEGPTWPLLWQILAAETKVTSRLSRSMCLRRKRGFIRSEDFKCEVVMSSTLRLCVRRMAFLLSIVILLVLATSVRADPKPLSKVEQAKVDKAVEKGVAFLKRKQTKAGDWPRHYRYSQLVAQCALPAYALLEAGVPANDPVIQKAAAFIRPKVLKSEGTYELSLAVLFLDRLGDPQDKKLIQSLALRLIAGQFRTGGWSYRCFTMSKDQEANLLKALRSLSKLMSEGKTTKEALRELELPPKMKALTVFLNPERLNWLEQASPSSMRDSIPLVGITDNSNTQFALLALWVAQRHDVPTEPTFRLLVERFERSQNLSGNWGYVYVNIKAAALSPVPSSNVVRGGGRSMTCVGLLGLAIGKGLKPSSPPNAAQAGSDDARIIAGLAALYPAVGVPTGQMDKPVLTQDAYYLWSVERVGMLFNLPTLGDKEWYRWGAESLVTNQLKTGEFITRDSLQDMSIGENAGRGNYGSILKSAFALLFLKHSHPMRDLTPKLPCTGMELH